MKIKCPRCQAFLTFDIESQSMECEFCGSIFGMEDIHTEADYMPEETKMVSKSQVPWMGEAKEPVSASAQEDIDSEDDISFKVFCCNSCGANLMVNETESATFCAYCGQPSLVMDRISKQKKPKFILPFKINKQEAEKIVKNRFSKGFFIPSSFKKIQVEKINGVYIPYRMVDMYCQDEVVISSEVSHGKSSSTVYFYRKGYNTFHQITVDASRKLNDESSVRLEPFDLHELKPFDAAYMSGFYADCKDVSHEELETVAYYRAKELFHEQLMESVKRGSNKRVIEDCGYHEIINDDYIMLPAWFVSFQDKGKNYTIMVNGQTGKCVGAVPMDRFRMWFCVIGIAALCTPIMTRIYDFLFSAEDTGRAIGTLMGFNFVLLIAAVNSFKTMKKSLQLTTASDIKHFANDRQEVS